MKTTLDPIRQFFGDPERVRGRIFSELKDKLSSPSNAAMARRLPKLAKLSLIDEISAGQVPTNASSDLILALLGACQIEVETVLPIWPNLDSDNSMQIFEEMAEEEFGPIARGDGDVDFSPEQRLYEMELFLRLRAIRHLFDQQ